MFSLIFVIILYFTFLGGSLYTITSFPLKVANHIVVTLILSVWLWGKLKPGSRQSLPRFPLEWPLLAWLVVQLLSASLGWYPRFSFESLWQPITHILALYLIIDLLPRWGGAFVRATYLSSAVVCLVGLAEFSSWYFGWPLLPQFQQSWFEIGGWTDPIPPYWYRLNFTLNGATSLSAYLALLIPPALTMWLTTRKKDDKQALAVWLLLALLVELLAFSRGGLLALGLSLPLCLTGWFLVSRGNTHYLKRLQQIPLKVVGIAVGAIIIISLIGVVVVGRRSLDASSGDQVRVNLWQSAIQMTVDQPILGVGPKIYGHALRDYRDPRFARNQITTAHNLYLNTAAETGLAGLLVGLWGLLALAIAAWRNWRQTTSPSHRIRLLGVGAALVGFAGQNLVDTFNATQIILPIIVGIAYLLIPHQVSYPQKKQVPWRSLALAGVVVGYGVMLGRWDVGQAAFERASRQASAENYSEAIIEIEQAIALDPQLHLYQFERAYYLAYQAQTKPEQLEAAIAQYRAALKQEASNPTYHANLAGLLAQAGELQQAITSLEMALAQAPNEPIYLLNLGQLQAQNNHREQALAYFTQAVIQQLALLDSRFWSAEDRQAIMMLAAEQIDSLAYRSQLTLTTGDIDAAENLARQAIDEQPSSTAWLALVKAKLAQNQPTAALEILSQNEAEFSKTDGEFYLRRGQARWLESRQNQADSPAFIRDLQIALFISPFTNREAYHYLGKWWESQGQIEAAIRAYYRAIPPQVITQNYDVVVYGRSTRHLPLVPQLVDPGLPESSAAPLLRLMDIYQATGEPDECTQLLRLFQQLYPYAQAGCKK